MGFLNIILDFSSNRYSDIELVGFGNQVFTKMTGNPDYPDPTPTLVKLKTDVDDFSTSIINANNGGKKETALKGEFRLIVETTLKTLGLYVLQASGGNEAKILGAGYEVRKKHEPIGDFDIPKNIILTPGKGKTTLEVTWDSVKKARYYELEYAEAPITETSVLRHETTPKRKFLIEGLTSGKQVGCRVTAAGSNPSRNWSDFVYSYVL